MQLRVWFGALTPKRWHAALVTLFVLFDGPSQRAKFGERDSWDERAAHLGGESLTSVSTIVM